MAVTGERRLHLDVRERRTSFGIRREVDLRADGESATVTVWYEIHDDSAGDLQVLDGLVQAVLLHCMTRGLPVRIHGNLSRSAAYNLREYQAAWSLWRPDVYRQVDLVPDAVVEVPTRCGAALQAFSGGVDATFTLIANKYLHKLGSGYDVDAAVLVHGFDVPLANADGFARLAERCRPALDRAGVALKCVRTNSRELSLQSWMDSTSLQLAACLHQFSDRYGSALMASAFPYDSMHYPNGSNPVTDHLLSGDAMAIVHDGAGYSRTRKVAAVAQFPDFVDQIKVCWQGPSAFENCGRCEKCVRTRLNFAAVGMDAPGCFTGKFDVRMLRGLRANTELQIAELRDVLDYVRANPRDISWDGALRRRIMLSRLLLHADRWLHWSRLMAALRSLRRKLKRARSPNDVRAHAGEGAG